MVVVAAEALGALVVHQSMYRTTVGVSVRMSPSVVGPHWSYYLKSSIELPMPHLLPLIRLVVCLVVVIVWNAQLYDPNRVIIRVCVIVAYHRLHVLVYLIVLSLLLLPL